MAVLLFNNVEEVDLIALLECEGVVRLGVKIALRSAIKSSGRARQASAHESLWLVRGGMGVRKAIGSSEQVHVVDALAMTGDEGRGSLREAAGSWQTSIDPQMSEWGNPARKGHSHLNS